MTNIVKDNNKEKNVYSGYDIAFDGKDSWSFNDNFVRKVTIVRVALVSHLILTKNGFKNDFLTLGERDTFGINGSFGEYQF